MGKRLVRTRNPAAGCRGAACALFEWINNVLSIAGMSNGISCTAHALFMRSTNPVHTDTIRKRTCFICFIEKSKAISLISIFVSHQKKVRISP